ncbi:cytochrome c biogenesis CcdA family protein [Actinoplanes sp. NPDC051859]|uniref:cytochrome c biogenesis CcdA family protein n=1 Tax=Actinoplanes sp. NPDC051859 TaxID=3363909 RepID=UPI0037BD2213
MGDFFADTAQSGPLLLAVVTAAIAGLVSFLSPCVLPLIPGYLSYVTGLAGSDLDATETKRVKGRILAGTSLFVLGFAVVFSLGAALVSNIGITLQTHKRMLDIVLGVLVIVLGIAFLGLIPGMQREFRISWLPNAGLLGAPVFGALFALSWIPCTGPTLGVVLGLAARAGETDRAVTLALAYSLGLGVPFVLFGLFFRRLLGVFAAVRRNSRWVTRIGGAMLIIVGIALVTGGWNSFLTWLLVQFPVVETLL